MNKENLLKIELIDDGLLHIAFRVIPDYYPDYFIGKTYYEEYLESEIQYDYINELLYNLTDEEKIEIFETLEIISNKRDMDDYELLEYNMGYYFGITNKKCISDSDKKIIKNYIDTLNEVYEDNQYDIEDYEDDDEDEGTMTAEDKYEYDKNQREFEYNRIIKIINNL